MAGGRAGFQFGATVGAYTEAGLRFVAGVALQTQQIWVPLLMAKVGASASPGGPAAEAGGSNEVAGSAERPLGGGDSEALNDFLSGLSDGSAGDNGLNLSDVYTGLQHWSELYGIFADALFSGSDKQVILGGDSPLVSDLKNHRGVVWARNIGRLCYSLQAYNLNMQDKGLIVSDHGDYFRVGLNFKAFFADPVSPQINHTIGSYRVDVFINKSDGHALFKVTNTMNLRSMSRYFGRGLVPGGYGPQVKHLFLWDEKL